MRVLDGELEETRVGSFLKSTSGEKPHLQGTHLRKGDPHMTFWAGLIRMVQIDVVVLSRELMTLPQVWEKTVHPPTLQREQNNTEEDTGVPSCVGFVSLR